LKDLPGLMDLSLRCTWISDSRLDALNDLKKLRPLGLGGTAPRETGVGKLKELTDLTELGLGCSTLTDLHDLPAAASAIRR
jgi:hypothetical protein